MPNPNNNKHFNDEALKINRTLKKENDALSEIIDEVEDFLLGCDVQTSAEDREIGRLQQMITNIRSRDNG